MKISTALFMTLAVAATAAEEGKSGSMRGRKLNVVEWGNCLKTCVDKGGLDATECAECLWSAVDNSAGTVGAHGLPASFAGKMLSLKLPGSTYTKKWCGKDTIEGCDVSTTFPGPEQTSLMKWDDVYNHGYSMPEKQLNGDVWRGNELGFIISNPYFWDRVEPKALLLGSTVQQHRSIRPLLDEIFGSNSDHWNPAMVTSAINKALADAKARGSLDVQNDIKILVHQLLVKIALKIDVSREDAQRFVDLQGKLTTFSTIAQLIPPEIAGFDVNDELMGIIGAKELRDTASAFIDSYTPIVKNLYGDKLASGINDCGATEGGCVVQFASGLFDAFFSAGGLSVPGGISTAMGVLYSTDNSNPAGRPLEYEKADAANLFYESIRYFAPVVGFPFWEKKPEPAFTQYECDGDSCTNQYGKGRVVGNLALANRDLRKWGADAEQFKIRSHAEYRDYFIGFAEMAKRNDVDQGRMNRNCPAKELSIVVGKTFFTLFEKSEWNLSPAADAITFTGSTPFVSEFKLFPSTVTCPYECSTFDVACKVSEAHCETCDACSKAPACSCSCRWWDAGCHWNCISCKAGKAHCNVVC